MGDLRGTSLGGHYTVDREIGRGGMATVWLAHDSQHDRRVAVKTLHPDLASAIGTDRFLRELRLTAQLQHPAIVPILDSGILENAEGTRLPWYVMPFLEGETLRTRLAREQQLSIDESLRVVDVVGAALDAAHAAHVVHRDIKPENIFLAGNQVYVVDFGIAKAIGSAEGERLTSTGLTLGTPLYMSPEQSVAGVVDERTDQYSLATVLYEMLAGEPPFTGPNTQSIIARRLSEKPHSLRTVRSAVPSSVERAIMRALELTPADRFRSIGNFIDALHSTDTVPEARASQHSVVPYAIAASGLLVIIAVASLLVRERTRKQQAAVGAVTAIYQRGMTDFDRRTPAGVIESVAAFREAIRRDSTFAPAWSGLAQAYSRANGRSFEIPGVPADQLLPLAIKAVDRSLSLDSMSADAWTTHAVLLKQVDPADSRLALRSVRRAIRLDSTSAPAWHYLAITLADSGDVDAALTAWRRSVRALPRYSEGLAFLALGHFWKGDFDSATFWADSAVAVDPNYLLARQVAGNIAVERGEYDRAETSFEAARRVSTGVEVVNSIAGLALVKARAAQSDARAALAHVDSLASQFQPVPLHTAVYLSQAYAALGDKDYAIAVLQRFPNRRHLHFQLHLRCDPPFWPLADDARFRQLVRQPPAAWGRAC